MRFVLLLAVVLVTGCQRKDGEKLGRIAQLTGEKVRAALPTKTPLGDIAPDASAAAKVRQRLKTDSYLVDLPIQVVEEEDGLHLRGRVPTAEHADLAHRLATQTVGVPKVVNELTVGP